MCGIFAYTGVRYIAQEVVLQGLKDLEYRGYDSWGMAVKLEREIWIKKDIGKIGKVSAKNFPQSNVGIGHTRWATHGGVTKENSHPHASCKKDIVLVHNGIIENYQEIKDSLKNDHVYSSETDTEILTHLIEEEYGRGDFKAAVISAFEKTTGSSAIIAFQKEKNEFIVMRRGSPLVLGYGEGENYIASDPAALLPHTKRVYFIEDGQGAVVSKDEIEVFDIASGARVKIRPQTIHWQLSQTKKDGFDHFMIKEIHEQPKIVKNILEKANHSDVRSYIKNAKDIWFIGSGTASYAARVARLMYIKYMQTNAGFIEGSEYKSIDPIISSKSVIVPFSQSGETMDIIEAISAAKGKNAKIAAFVNVEGATLYRQSDTATLLQAGPEKAVASTKAFMAKLAHIYMLTHPKNTDDGMSNKIVSSIKTQLQDESMQKIRRIAHLLSGAQHMYVLGKGLHYPIALEAALKIKEVSYIHTEGLASGEIKHGVIALIEKGTPCIVYVPNDEHFTDNLTAAMELQARGALIIGVSPKNHESFDHHIPIPNLDEMSIFSSTVVGQVLAYYLALEKNLDPDMPRNLAKSVTVK